MKDDSDTSRRSFMENIGSLLTMERTLTGGVAALIGYNTNEYRKARGHRVDTVDTPGFSNEGVKELLEKTAEAETQKIGLYRLAEGGANHPSDIEYPENNFNWTNVTDYTEDLLSQLHPNIDLEIEYENITSEQLAERTGKTVEEAKQHIQDIYMPSRQPGFCSISLNNVKNDIEPLGIDEENDGQVYISDFNSILTIGRALQGYGEAYIDSTSLDSEEEAGWTIAHEIGHLYGLDDTYTPLISSGEGLMGLDPEETHISEETNEEFDKIMQKFNCCH